MRGTDGNRQTGLSSTNDQVTFRLRGGRYQLQAIATWGGGSATFEMLGPDGSTYLTVGTAITANGTQVVEVPEGTFRWTIVTASAASLAVVRIPGE
ncbi:MAG: hypothetical protein E6Q97_28365 [Desulfurellales bacterium]|nr:MAG: hypothetical protein E6Q97_28365 [Desulfurellales bacterium]